MTTNILIHCIGTFSTAQKWQIYKLTVHHSGLVTGGGLKKMPMGGAGGWGGFI